MTSLNGDLYRALTGSDCTCERDRIDEGNERLPRILRITDPDCPEHGIRNLAWERHR